MRREEKKLAQIFRKDLTERKLENIRTRINKMLSVSSLSVFYSKFTSSRVSTRISKFYDPTDSEHKFNKTRNKNWQSIGFEVESP